MRRPNLVFILADDLGWCDLGGFGGSPFYESPHIDRLAREGMRFTQAYAACQVSSPSRASILTGKWPTRHGITDYLGARSGEAWRSLGRFDRMLPAAYAPRLGADETTRRLWEKYRRKAVARGAAGPRFAFDRKLPVRQVQDCPVYAGMIETMDAAVGLVLDALDRNGLGENTVVCFTSDNGGVSSGDSFSSSMLPLRGGKGRQWEGGIREPLYVRFPRLVAAGSACGVPVSGIDFYPTLLELAGVERPAAQAVDGRSLVPLLRGGEDAALAGRDLFWHYPHYGNQGGDPSSIVRRGPWKLIHYHEDGHDELYHLERDPGEREDVGAANAATAAALRGRLDAWLAETGAKFPVPDPEYDPAKQAAYLRRMEGAFRERLESEHARYLDPEWQPNEDWWGSAAAAD